MPKSSIDQRLPRSSGVAAKTWQALLPPDRPNADVLRPRHGLKSRYKTLGQATNSLTVAQAQHALVHFTSANYYCNVLSGGISYLPPLGVTDDFTTALKSLFDFAFDLLGELDNVPSDGLKIRDSLYSRAYKAMPGHFCPFCGIDRFDAPHPDMPRHALDHYLAVSVYSLFGAHLQNLVPMCSRCNSSFKLAIDMLKADNGTPRSCVDPYGGQTAKVSLMNSTPFGGGKSGQLPQWQIDFVPAINEFETWDSVFKVRLRYKESLLDAEYMAWLDDFARWVKVSQIAITNNEEASAALAKWALLCPELNDLGFVKRPMFEMLAASALQQGLAGNRVTNLISNLCSMG